MTRITSNVLSVTLFNVVNERLFSIVNRIYNFHKSFHSVIIRVKMIIRQFDYKENEFEILNNFQSNLKEEEKNSKKNLKKKLKFVIKLCKTRSMYISMTLMKMHRS